MGYSYKLPKNFELISSQNKIYLKGPKGQVDMTFLKNISYSIEDNIVTTPKNFKKVFDRNVKGLISGFKLELELVGIGYRAQLAHGMLTLRVGFSHDILIQTPDNIEIFLEDEKTIICYSVDYQNLTNFCAKIINLKPINIFTAQGIKLKGSKTIQKVKKK